MMKGIKEEDDEEAESLVESRLSEFQPNHKVKILTTTKSLPPGTNLDQDDQNNSGKISRQQSLPVRRPHPLIRMNSDPKMLPSIELSLPKDAADCEEMSLNELRKRLQNCGRKTHTHDLPTKLERFASFSRVLQTKLDRFF